MYDDLFDDLPDIKNKIDSSLVEQAYTVLEVDYTFSLEEEASPLVWKKNADGVYEQINLEKLYEIPWELQTDFDFDFLANRNFSFPMCLEEDTDRQYNIEE